MCDWLFSLSPRAFTLVSVLIGFILIDDLTVAEQNALGNFLMLVGQLLETNSAQQAVINSRENNNETDKLKQEIENLKSRMAKFDK